MVPQITNLQIPLSDSLIIKIHCVIIFSTRKISLKKIPHNPWMNTYTVLHIFRQVLFWAGNQGNHQNFKKSLLSYKCWLIFLGWSKKKIKMADSKKLRFSTPPILNIFSWKFYGLVLGSVELIDAKGIDVAQPIWSSGCPTWVQKRAKNAF